jgi:type III restriction enzyme
VRILKEKLVEHLVNGIEYIRVSDLPGANGLPSEERWYEMRQMLDDQEIELFSKHIFSTAEEKSVYDLVPCDSEVERKFVEDLEARTDVKLYLKLPYWFTVPTPVGEYRPDWALVMEGPEENGKPVLYLVSETKGSTKKDELRPNEWQRIQCGAACFGSKQFNRKGALEEVDFSLVKEAGALPYGK